MIATPALRKLVIPVALALSAGCTQRASTPVAIMREATLPPGPLANISTEAVRGLVKTVLWQGCTARERDGTTPGSHTRVSICAADYARGVGKGNTNSNGVIVARMINRGTSVVEKRWGLVPGDTSYIVGFPGSDTQGAYAIIQIPKNSSAGTKITVLKENGTFVYCWHVASSASSADFRTCREGPEFSSRRNSSTDGAVLAGPNSSAAGEPLSSGDGPAWVSCISGCCTTEAS